MMTIPVKPPTDAPRYIRLNEADNVAIIVNAFGMPAGTKFPGGLTLREFVPQGHKVALTDIAKDAAIIRYGDVIGCCRTIPMSMTSSRSPMSMAAASPSTRRCRKSRSARCKISPAIRTTAARS